MSRGKLVFFHGWLNSVQVTLLSYRTSEWVTARVKGNTRTSWEEGGSSPNSEDYERLIMKNTVAITYVENIKTYIYMYKDLHWVYVLGVIIVMLSLQYGRDSFVMFQVNILTPVYLLFYLFFVYWTIKRKFPSFPINF